MKMKFARNCLRNGNQAKKKKKSIDIDLQHKSHSIYLGYILHGRAQFILGAHKLFFFRVTDKHSHRSNLCINVISNIPEDEK